MKVEKREVPLLGFALTISRMGMTIHEPKAVVNRFIDCVTDRIASGA